MEKPNPFIERGLKNAGGYGNTSSMSVTGTAVKTFILLAILVISASITWNGGGSMGLLIGASIGAAIVAVVTSFTPTLSPITAPIYAILEGMLLGSFTGIVSRQYSGAVLAAVLLTAAVAISMLLIYRQRGLSNRLRNTIVIATMGVSIIYLLSFVLSLFGIYMPFIYGSGITGIVFSIAIAALAAFNLLVDYDYVLRMTYSGAPKYMEWYGGFGILVTLVWLFLRILRLVMIFMDNRDN